MAKMILTLSIFIIFSCNNNNENLFIENKTSLDLHLSNGIEYSFPENTIKNLNVSQASDTILLSIAEKETLINLYYNTNIDTFIGEKAIVGKHNSFPRIVDNLVVFHDKKKTANLIVLASNLTEYYGSDDDELAIFNLRDFILKTLNKKESFKKLTEKTINEYNKIPIHEKLKL